MYAIWDLLNRLQENNMEQERNQYWLCVDNC